MFSFFEKNKFIPEKHFSKIRFSVLFLQKAYHVLFYKVFR